MDARRLTWIMLAFGAGLLITMFAAKTCAKRNGEPTTRPTNSSKTKPTTTSAPATKPATRPTTRTVGATIGKPKPHDGPKPPSHEGDLNNTSLYLPQGSLDPLDPDSGYKFQVQFNTNGASIHTVKLSNHYATVEDKLLAENVGYEKYFQALAKGDNKDLHGPYSLLNPVSHKGVVYYAMATRNVRVTLPAGPLSPYRHDPQLRSESHRSMYGAWRAWKVLTEKQAKKLGLGSTADIQRLSFSWAFEHRTGPNAKYRPVIRLIKTYGVRKNDFTIYVSLRVENLWVGDKPLTVEIDQAGPTGLPLEGIREDKRKVAYGKYDGEDKKVVVAAQQRKAEIKEVKIGSPVNVGESSDDDPMLWIGQTNKFFGCMLYLRPDKEELPEKLEDYPAPTWQAEFYHQDVKEHSATDKKGSPTQMTGIRFPGIKVEKGKPRTIRFELFAGPKDINMFEADERYSVLAYEDTIDLSSCFCGLCAWDGLSLFVIGFLGTLARNVTFNYGLAIFLLVVIVRLLLHPLTKKGQVTMARMKKLQPMMKELEKKYADDKETMNRERIKLFKQHGATPFLGCLPMLLQMPILIALWRGINATSDLRHAAFLPVWIVDLSAPDRLFAFGTDVPLLGEYLNLLPLLLGAAMYWQMKLSPQSQTASPDQEKQQKMMQMIFPIMMPVMFYSLASGLTLYFLASTFFGAVEQHYIRKHIEAKEAMASAVETTVRMPGKGPRGSRPKKPKGPNWFKRG